MDGYYDDHALVTLPRHLALVGLVTADPRRVAHQLAALYGLPFFDLDRLVEHRAGQSLWALAVTRGPERYRQIERETLAGVLADRPHGLVALGDGTLLDAESRRRVLAETTLVVLDRDLANCYWRFQSLRSDLPEGIWHPLHPGPLASIDDLRPFVAERLPTFAGAHHVLELAGRPAATAVDRLMALVQEMA